MENLSQNPKAGDDEFNGNAEHVRPLKTFERKDAKELYVKESFFVRPRVQVRPVMAEFYLRVRQAAMLDVPVLLVGESGSGKNHTARLIHSKSKKNKAEYFEVNINEINENLIESTLFGCEKGAFTGAEDKKGLFESASNGTLFLDEIGDFPKNLQTKLFGFLDNGCYRKIGSVKTLTSSTRLMFATNSNLYELVKRGRFRSELYYRISVFIIVVPPLREHPQDIPELAMEFAEANGRRLSSGALKKLCSHTWPGNVRELKNCILRSCVCSSCSEISEEDIIFDQEIFDGFATYI